MAGEHTERAVARSGGRDPAPPFSLALPGREATGQLVCEHAVRLLPGRRLVCAGRWQGEQVFAKLFYGAGKARSDWRRERRGIRHLAAAGIATPPLLYAGHAPQGRCHVLVTAAVIPSQTLEQRWQRAGGGPEDREALLDAMARLFARLHDAGITHEDPHLNNFLLAGADIYTLDGADVRRHRTPLRAGPALANLAAFFSIVLADARAQQRAFFDAYAAARNTPAGGIDYRDFAARVVKIRERNIRKYLAEKIFRECTAFARRRTFTRLIMLARRYDTPALQRLLAAPARALSGAAATPLKRGNTATVAALQVDGRQLVIKHYRRKGLLHGLRKACVRSRAERSWINAHRLLRCGIRTAQPVALVLETLGPFRRAAYFIAERVSGPNAAGYFASADIDMAEKTRVASEVAELLRRLAENRLSHGDLKASNIIISTEGPVLLDLDSMRQYGSDTRKFRRALGKDLARFARNWAGDSDSDRLLRDLGAGIARDFL